jgi:hypothetical protein
MTTTPADKLAAVVADMQAGKKDDWAERLLPILAELQRAQWRLTEQQVEQVLCGDVYDINDDPDTKKLTIALNALLSTPTPEEKK